MGTLIEHARQHMTCCVPSTLLMSSPVPHLITCNDPPSQEEIVLIQEAISIAQFNLIKLQRRESCDVDLSPVAPLNHALRDPPSPLEDFIHVHQSLLSVKRTFPPELWTLVFNHVLATDYTPNCKDIAQATTLASVSRVWRSIALSDPLLWGKLPTFSISKRKSRSPEYVHYIRTILERGAETPLSFHINAPFEVIHSHLLLDLLMAHSHRWGHIILGTTAMTVQGLNVSGSLSSLHTLELQVDNLKPFPRTITIFREAPALRTVRVCGLWPVSIELPWNQLEEYHERTPNNIGLIEVLRHSTKLRNLSYTTHLFGYSNQELPNVVFSNLISLRLHHIQYGGDFGPLLENVKLPMLEDIGISSRSGDLIAQSIQLIRRSGCNLRRLSLFTNPLAAHAGMLTDLLRLTPSLEVLEINDIPTPDLDNMSQSRLVPLLRSLTIHFEGSPTAPPPVVDSKRVNALAGFRCSSERTTLSGDCLQLQELKLVFQSIRECLSSHAMLEGWDQDDVQRCHVESELSEACVRGLEEMIHSKPAIPSPRNPVVTHNRMNIAHLQETLHKLRELSEVNSRVLSHSNVIFYIQTIESMLDKILPEVRQEVTETILLLRRRLKANAKRDGLQMKWSRRGARSLVYYPMNLMENTDSQDS